MIALDTNILARYLLKDDIKQFDRARILIEVCSMPCTGTRRAWISLMLCTLP
jgi:predicted nucleic-acid-binding protein